MPIHCQRRGPKHNPWKSARLRSVAKPNPNTFDFRGPDTVGGEGATTISGGRHAHSVSRGPITISGLTRPVRNQRQGFNTIRGPRNPQGVSRSPNAIIGLPRPRHNQQRGPKHNQPRPTSSRRVVGPRPRSADCRCPDTIRGEAANTSSGDRTVQGVSRGPNTIGAIIGKRTSEALAQSAAIFNRQQSEAEKVKACCEPPNPITGRPVPRIISCSLNGPGFIVRICIRAYSVMR